MKRPTIDVIYSAVDRPAEAVAHSINDLLLTQYKDTYLRDYFAELCFDRQSGSYEPVNECLDLKGTDDLVARVRRLGSGCWTLDVNLGFAPVVLDVGVFTDPPDTDEISTIVIADPAITKFLEEFSDAHPLFALFLIRVAVAINADFFIAALERDYWRRLIVDQLVDRAAWPPGTYVVGWRAGAVDRRHAVASWRLPGDRFARTTMGFEFVTLIPEP